MNASALGRRFSRAKPFPHVVIDGFLPEELCAGLEAEFPPYDASRFRNQYGHPAKASYEDVRGLGPSFRKLDGMARSPDFLAWLGALTGIRGLMYDPDYMGGGAQENMDDMRLWPHIDFNVHSRGWLRRVNLLLYLNRGWREELGGCLALHDGPKDARPVRVAPLLNRCVIFATGSGSWHSVDVVRQAEPGRGRRSVSMYFYTKPAGARRIRSHSTIWVYPSLPKAVRSGAVIDEALIQQVNRALALRDIEQAFWDGVKEDRWLSPLPRAWRPGYRLTSGDVRWLRGQLDERQRLLEDSWWYRRERDPLELAVRRHRRSLLRR